MLSWSEYENVRYQIETEGKTTLQDKRITADVIFSEQVDLEKERSKSYRPCLPYV